MSARLNIPVKLGRPDWTFLDSSTTSVHTYVASNITDSSQRVFDSSMKSVAELRLPVYEESGSPNSATDFKDFQSASYEKMKFVSNFCLLKSEFIMDWLAVKRLIC